MTDEKFKKIVIISAILFGLAAVLFLIDFLVVKPQLEEGEMNTNTGQEINQNINSDERL